MGNICRPKKKVRFEESDDIHVEQDKIADHSVGRFNNGSKVIVLREPLPHTSSVLSSESLTENSSRESSASVFSLGSKIVSQAKRNVRQDNRPHRPEFLGRDSKELFESKPLRWFVNRLKKGRFDDETELHGKTTTEIPRLNLPRSNGIHPSCSLSPKTQSYRRSSRLHSANSSSSSSLHSNSTRSLKTLMFAMAPALPGTVAEDSEDRQKKHTTLHKPVTTGKKQLELRTAEVKRHLYPGYQLYKQFSHGNFKNDSSFFENSIKDQK